MMENLSWVANLRKVIFVSLVIWENSLCSNQWHVRWVGVLEFWLLMKISIIANEQAMNMSD